MRPEARYIAATCGGVRVAGVYVPNGRTPQDPHFEYKLAWLHALAGHLAPVAAAEAPFAVLGDFNVAPADDDVWDIAAFAQSTHVTPAERAALAELRALGLSDVVPTISKGPHPYTFWDYRAGDVPQGDGDADRPRVRQCRVRRRGAQRRGRPGGAQARGQGHPGPQRPRPGDRRPGLSRPVPCCSVHGPALLRSMNPADSLREHYLSAKPVLRGWLHLVAAPIAGAAAVLLAILAPSDLRIPAILFALTTILLFSVSAVYHRGRFSPRVTGLLQRWDHANIFLVIAGSATPFAVALLGPGPARSLLAVLWLGAVGGAVVRLAWVRAPRWLFVPMYLALGWASAMFLPGFLRLGQPVGRPACLGPGPDPVRRDPLHGRCRGVRHQVAQPVTEVVRVPRGLPLVHPGRLGVALRRGHVGRHGRAIASTTGTRAASGGTHGTG